MRTVWALVVLFTGCGTGIIGPLPAALTSADGGLRSPDAGTTDAGIADARPRDAGRPDAAVLDSGEPDDGGTGAAGPPDAGAADAGSEDAGDPDAGLRDGGLADAGLADAGPVDAGLSDAGLSDAGLFDAGHVVLTARDAGEVLIDAGFWAWAGVNELLSRTATDGGVRVRWVELAGPSPVDRAWAGGVLLLDGGVVCVPFNEASVLLISPADDRTERWPIAGGAVAEGWVGGVLLPSGVVIGVPRLARQFLRIDPATRTATPFGDDLSDVPTDGGIGRFRGAVLAHNGLIYAAPGNADVIARLDPATGRVTRIPLPLNRGEGRTHGPVLFPTGDIVMFPIGDEPGLLVIPSRDGGADDVWLLPHPDMVSVIPAFAGGGFLTGADTALGAPQQNVYPLRYDRGLFAWGPEATSLDGGSANAFFYGAWSTDGHFYMPPVGGPFVLRLDKAGASEPVDAGAPWFRATLGAVGLPDGRVIGVPHGRPAWLELWPDDAVPVPLETMTSPFLNKL